MFIHFTDEVLVLTHFLFNALELLMKRKKMIEF